MDKFSFNALLRQIDSGDENALKKLYDCYGKFVMWIAFSVVKDWHHCQDVLDIVMIQIWNNSSNIKKVNNPAAYMRKTAFNAAVSYYNKYLSKDRKYTAELCDDFAKGKDDLYEGNEKSDFMQTISGLSESEQQVVFFRIYCEMTFEQIAEIMRMPKSTVVWTYNNGIEKLRQKNI